MILNKLYYEEKNKLANKYSIIYNLLNFILLIGTSLITKNQSIIICVTLIPLALYTIYIIIKNSNKFKLKLDILKCIKYDSVELFNNIAFFLIFLFGLSNALEFGEKYATALTFVALITDTQWDTADAIVTAATIDISKNEFNYKYHRNNAYKLLGILFTTSLVMFVCLYGFYSLNFKITMIYFGFEIIKIDGHDITEIIKAFDVAKNVKGKPTCIIAKTIKGKGISFMENQVGWHGKAPNEEQYIQALQELEEK